MLAWPKWMEPRTAGWDGLEDLRSPQAPVVEIVEFPRGIPRGKRGIGTTRPPGNSRDVEFQEGEGAGAQELRVLRQGWPGYLLAGGGAERSVVNDAYDGCCISVLLPNVQLHLSRHRT